MNPSLSLSPLLRHLRLSPLMATALAIAIVCDFAGAAALGMAMFSGETPEEAVRADWRPPSVAQDSVDPAKSASADTHTLTRPVFSKTRTPFVPKQAPVEPPVAAASAPGAFTLSALIRHQKNIRAFVASAATPHGKWCAVGDQIDGWTVTQIQSAAVILQNGGKAVRLTLYPELSN